MGSPSRNRVSSLVCVLARLATIVPNCAFTFILATDVPQFAFDCLARSTVPKFGFQLQKPYLTTRLLLLRHVPAMTAKGLSGIDPISLKEPTPVPGNSRPWYHSLLPAGRNISTWAEDFSCFPRFLP